MSGDDDDGSCGGGGDILDSEAEKVPRNARRWVLLGTNKRRMCRETAVCRRVLRSRG